MKNREKYAAELMEIAISGKMVAIVNGKPVACSNAPVNCEGCPCNDRQNMLCVRRRIREWAESEYEEPSVDWSKVPVDTKVLVLDENGEWLHRHFCRYENDMVYVYGYGCTSWSGVFVTPYKTAKLAEKI